MNICPVCKSHGVDPEHVNRCKDRKALRDRVTRHAAEFGVNEVKALDLLAHVRSGGRLHDPAAIVSVVLELGWRPAVPQYTTEHPITGEVRDV